MSEKVKHFNAYRSKMNDRILAAENTGIKRFFNLDTAAYQDGALPAKTKEMLGLCASMVLRCNDCITYHVLQCKELGVSTNGVRRDNEHLAGGGRVDHHTAYPQGV